MNFHEKDRLDATMNLTIKPARPDERAAAFRLAFGHLSKADQETRVGLALEMIQKGELDPAGLWVAREDALQGALLCQAMPGAAGLIWPPRLVDAERRILEDLLVQHACGWLRGQAPGWRRPCCPRTRRTWPCHWNAMASITSPRSCTCAAGWRRRRMRNPIA